MTFDAVTALEGTRFNTPKTLAVVGGTSGIGAAVARRFAALGCSRIIIVGRSEARAAEQLRRLEAAGAGMSTQFIQGDVSTRAGMRACAAALKEAGKGKIDYLVMTQNGVPLKGWEETVDGDGTAFATQALSRFVISQSLITNGGLAPGATIVSVANPGNSLDTLDVDDLSLKTAMKTYWTTPTWFVAQSFRDSSVLDAFMLEQAARYRQYKFFHIAPGLVGSNGFDHNAFPFPFNWGTWTFDKLGGFATPDNVAAVPVYAAIYPDKAAEIAKGYFLNAKFDATPPGKWAQNKANRLALWDKLLPLTRG